MATYTEIRGLFNNSELLGKVEVATVKHASTLLDGTPTANDRAWAADVFGNAKSESKKALMAVLATNSGLDSSAIIGASDSAIQSSVDAVAPSLVLAKAGS